jgi:V/A-type H+-transporting ATPase subunit I
LITPAVAAVIVGLAVLISLQGFMGILLGPLELISSIGNILSYLRLAAIGLASVYLARVANELAGTGPLWMGVMVGALFHALNLLLGTFSPTIQALRLHYVEFFSKFYQEGGESFRPFGLPQPTEERK